MTYVLIVDDSALMRQKLSESFAGAADIELDTAMDPLFALQKMQRRWPDVVVLDLEMPRMDGLTFLKKLMKERPTPVVVCSTLTEKGAHASIQALAAGAIAVFPKNQIKSVDGKVELQQALLHAVREAAESRHGLARRAVVQQQHLQAPPAPKPRVLPTAGPPIPPGRVSLIALGASTGGTVALEEVLVKLPAHSPGIVIVQHMPEKFTRAFAERLDSLTQVRVREAQGGEPIIPGMAYIAPGGRHLSVVRSDAGLVTRVFDAPPVNRHRPSVDVLFQSVAKVHAAGTLAVLMTGMGDDGARGLLALREAGAFTAAQDEATSVVFGMPAQAIKLDAAQRVVALPDIGPLIAATAAQKAA